MINDEAYMAELRERNIAESQKFIFEGFFNKVVERITGEYSV